MLGFFKTASTRKLPRLLVDSYLALSNGVVMHLNGTTNEVTRLTPSGNGANFGDLASVCASPDGKYIYWPTGGNGYTYFLYKREGDVLTQLSLPTPGPHGCASFSPDGEILMTSAAGGVYKNNKDDTFTTLAPLAWGGQLGAGLAVWTGDSKYTLIPASYPFVRGFRRNADNSFTEVVASPQVLPAMPTVMMIDTYSFICFFNTADAPSAWTLDPVANAYTSMALNGITTRNITDCSQSSDGTYLALSHTAGVDLYKKLSLGNYQYIGALSGVTSKANSVAWTADGKFLAVGMSVATPALLFYVRNGDVLTQVSVPATIGGWNNSGQVNHLVFS